MDNDKLELYKIAVGTRQFEIQMLWQRSNYFLIFQTALVVGLAAAKQDRWVSALVSLLGVATAIVWCMVNAGSKYWQVRWEAAAARLEGDIAKDARLFAASGDEVHSEVEKSLEASGHNPLVRLIDRFVLYKPSVSLMMMVLSLGSFVVWAGLLFRFIFKRCLT
jgi:hypothetical protein